MALYSSEKNKVWETARKKLQDHYRWASEWNTRKTGGFLLSQNEFVDDLREIQISSRRRKEIDSPITPQEQTELRGLLGGLGWKCEQTGPHRNTALRQDFNVPELSKRLSRT